MKLDVPSRASFQQTDVGPIFNDLALRSYDMLEQGVEPKLFTHINRSNPVAMDLVKMLDIVIDFVNGVARDQVRDLPMHARYAVKGTLSRPIGDYASSTFYQGIEPQLKEGLRSGIVMPARAYFALLGDKRNVDIQAETAVDPEDAAFTLRSHHFLASLLTLSNTTNGLYGSQSSELLESTFSFSDIWSFNDGKPVFEQLGSSGQWIASKDTKSSLKKIRKLANDRNGGNYTDGCPVRRSVYPRLGNYALRYAEAMDMDPADLSIQPCSSIVRGSLLVANMIELCFNEPSEIDRSLNHQ